MLQWTTWRAARQRPWGLAQCERQFRCLRRAWADTGELEQVPKPFRQLERHWGQKDSARRVVVAGSVNRTVAAATGNLPRRVRTAAGLVAAVVGAGLVGTVVAAVGPDVGLSETGVPGCSFVPGTAAGIAEVVSVVGLAAVDLRTVVADSVVELEALPVAVAARGAAALGLYVVEEPVAA